MAKFISALIAICALSVNITAFAATSDGNLQVPSRNDIETLGASVTDSSALPAFRPGDTLQFNVSALTTSKELGLISYKYNATLSDSTVQYFNQYTVDSSTKTISYKIRDIADGIYKIVLNGNDGTAVANFYYKVGNPQVSIVKGNGGTTNYYASQAFPQEDGSTKYSIAFLAKLTMSGNDVSLQDAGINSAGLEFNINENKVVRDLTAEQISELLSGEIGGTATVYYGLTMYKVPQTDMNNIVAIPRLDGVAVSAE